MRERRGASSLCSKGPAVEDLMALSVQSLVGSLTGYRCLLWDGFIPNESELQQCCTQSSAALDSVCLPPPAPPSLSSSLSTERCACPQPVCDTDVFLRRDAYPAGKHLEAEKSPSKSRRHGLFCTQGLLTKWDSSLCLSPCLHRSLHRGTGPQVLSGVPLLVLRFGVSSRFISVSCQDYINLLQDHVKKGQLWFFS